MKIKFNKFERVAGVFVLTAIIGGIAVMVGVAVKKGWFETKIKFETTLKNADGVRDGTVVQMAGLRAGVVTHVELKSNNEIFVRFEISERYYNNIKTDSVVRVIRPFIIGEKVLDLSVGSEAEQRVAKNAQIPSEATTDIMDLVSGRTLGPYLESMTKLMENLRFVVEQLGNPERTKAMVAIFDEISPLVKNSNGLITEVRGLMKDTNKGHQLVTIVNDLAKMTKEVNKLLPIVNKVMPTLAENSPQLTADLAKIAKNTAVLTDEIQKTIPTLKEMAPEMPRAGRRAIEALDETVVVLKALQKSFILSGKVQDVRDEEAKREKSRQPANEPKAD